MFILTQKKKLKWFKNKLLISTIISICMYAANNINMTVTAVDLTVPGTNPTVNSAVTQSNATAGGTNTLSIGADQTILSAIPSITQNLAISGDNPTPWTVNLNHTSGQKFTFTTGVYSISDLIITNGLGGAVSKGVGTLTIDNVTFSNNTLDNTAVNGGAISNSGGILTINDSTFTNNSTATAGGSGGAVHSSAGTINIDGSTFTDNTATSGGGAVLSSPTATTTITNSIFTNNTANGGSNAGAAFFNNAGTATIGNSIFTGNRGTASGASGGAVINYAGGTMHVTGSTFINNSTGSLGGAIYNYTNGKLDIADSSFTSNSANNGGALSNASGGTLTILGGNTFSGNRATTQGGAIYNNSSGILNLDASEGDIIFSGNTRGAISNDIYNSVAASIINIIGTGTISLDGGIGGVGTIRKSSTGSLLMDGNSSFFTGTFNQTAGTTIVSAAGRVFGGTNNISNSIFQVTGLPLYYNVNLGNNALFTNIAATIEGGTVSSSNIHFTGSGASATFTKDPALVQDVNANYTLANKIDNAQTNTVIFDNANVFVGATDYTGSTIYSFQNSTMDITSSGTRNINFTNLNTNNAKIAFDLSFDREPPGVVLNSDTLTAANVTGDGILAIHTIKVVNDHDDGLTGTREAQILFGSGLNFDTTATFDNVATIAYEYTTTIDPVDNTKILLTVVNPSTENSLAKMNTLGGNRGFNFSFFEGESIVYNIGSSLGETAPGTLVVQGFDTNPTHGIISGNIVDAGGTIIGQGSLFRLSENTDLTVANLTLQDAFMDGDGSAIFLNNPDAVAEIYNSIVQNNTSTGLGGAVFNAAKTLAVEKGTFNSNQGQNGGAIYNEGILEMIFDSFNSNQATENGGAIYTSNGALAIDFTSFSSNTAGGSGGAIFNTGGELTLGAVSFQSNSATGDGGAIYNADVMNILGATTFSNNTSTSGNGGAIFNSNTLTLNSNHGDIVFSGNSASQVPNDIYNDDATVNVDGIGGTVYLEDGIAGSGIINKSGNSTLVLGGNNSNYTGDFIQTGGTTNVTGTFFTGSDTISILNSTLNLGPQAFFNNTNILNVNDSTINSINGVIQANTINTLNVGSGTANFAIDVNGFNGISDQYIVQNINGPGTINISNISIVGEAPTATRIPFLAFDSSNIDGSVIFQTTVKEIQTPIYRYTLVSDGNGQFSLVRIGSELNPQAFRGQVATMAAYYNQLIIDNLLFDHVHLESGIVTASIFDNKYANIYPQFAPYQYSRENAGLWYKAYSTMENLLMTQDLDIRNYAYGSLIGADFEAVKLQDGWKLLPTAYIAYNGGHQTFDNVSIYQNGGQAGAMATFMKENFIGSILAYAGGYSNEMNLEGFSDNTGNWFAGTAAKTAYNIRAARNFTLQPTAMIAYNIFGKQHWGSDFGAVSMNSGLLNGINVAPGLNFIYNQETWSLYGITQYVFNINDNINGSIGPVNLPDLSMRHGFIEYGLGVTKTWQDRFLGYFQATLRNGGRNGIGLQAGITYRL